MMINLLKNITKKRFLDNYWGKKPLFIENVVSHYKETLNINKILLLMQNEEIFTKKISSYKKKFATEFGPFKKNILNKGNPYSVLLHKMHLYHSYSNVLFNSVDFIPNCLLDDVMVSYSSNKGSVGPHSDSYDVFLFQGNGEKKWHIGGALNDEPRQSGPLKIIKHFKKESEFHLKPGDLLYLPPNTSHHGIAFTDDCVTYSIGFKSPSTVDLKQKYLEYLMDNIDTDNKIFYKYSYPDKINSKSMIPESLEIFSRRNIDLNSKKDNFKTYLGEFLTEPDFDVYFQQKRLSKQKFSSLLLTKTIYLNLTTKAFYLDNILFMNGVRLNLKKTNLRILKEFFNTKHYTFSRKEINTELINYLHQAYLDGFISAQPPKFIF